MTQDIKGKLFTECYQAFGFIHCCVNRFTTIVIVIVVVDVGVDVVVIALATVAVGCLQF